ncbi:transposase family protein [Streptomyces sp. HD]|nr:transposase family protein [Streptomyces sp. HD]
MLGDGTLVPTQHRTGTADRPNYSGKHHRRGLHCLALTDEPGRLIWISAAGPGRDHLLAHLPAVGLGALADLGYVGVDDAPDTPVVVTGFKATRADKLTTGQKEANRVHASGRAPSSTASPTSRTGGPSPNSAPTPARATHLLRGLLVGAPGAHPDALTPHEPRGAPGETDRLQPPINRGSRSNAVAIARGRTLLCSAPGGGAGVCRCR